MRHDMATPLEQLDAMHQVPENWNGYGGFAPQPEAIREAIAFYRSIESEPELASPYLSPTPNGGIQFEWDNGPHHLEIAFEPLSPSGPIGVEFLYDNTQTGDVVEGKVRQSVGTEMMPYPLRQIVSGFATTAA